jgi:hypothetical protein
MLDRLLVMNARLSLNYARTHPGHFDLSHARRTPGAKPAAKDAPPEFLAAPGKLPHSGGAGRGGFPSKFPLVYASLAEGPT